MGRASRVAAILVIVVTLALIGAGGWRGLHAVAATERRQTWTPSPVEAAAGSAPGPEWRIVDGTGVSCSSGSVVADNFAGRSLSSEWEHHGTEIGAELRSGVLRLGGPLDNDAFAALRSARPVRVTQRSAFVTVVRPSVRRTRGSYVVLSPVRPPDLTTTAQLLAAGVGWVGGQAPPIDRQLDRRDDVSVERGINRWTPTLDGPLTYSDYADNVDTLLAVIPRPGAVYMLLQPLGMGERPRLSYIGPPLRERDVTVNLASANEWGGDQSASWVKLACFGDFDWDPDAASLVVDHFDRLDGGSVGRPDLGPGEWDAAGAWRIERGRLLAEGDASLVIDLGSERGWISATLRQPSAGDGMARIIFGHRGPEEYLAWEIGGGIGRVIKRRADDLTVLHEQAFPPGLGDVRVSVTLLESGVQLWRDGASFTEGDAPLALDGADLIGGVGLACVAGGCEFDDVRVMPRTVAPPVGFERVLSMPAAPSGDPIVTDTLSGPAGARLAGRDEPAGQTWRVQGAAWEIGVDGLIRTKGRSLATIDAGATDVEVSARLRIVTGPDIEAQYPGVSARATDLNNRIWARLLWQEGSPEIELWETLDGRPALLNAVNVSGRVERNEEHELRLVVAGADVAGYLGDRLMVQGQLSPDAVRRLRSSRVGVSQDGEAARSTFRAFAVRAAVRQVVARPDDTDLAGDSRSARAP
ncbi:MAG: hypothetical protein M3O34_05855 [Chloroflexota bacterium]|nr:hypothetical protein [Chloroflexota bacterium]